MALQHAGRAAEAQNLLQCIRRQVAKQLGQRFRANDDAPGELEMMQASVLAIRNDPKAIDWLDKAVKRGWLGQYYSSSLADWPQFDRFSADARYTAVQQRLRATIARERAEALAS